MLSAPDFKEKKIIIVFLNQGEKISFRNDNLIVRDKGGKVKHQSTCYRIFAVFVVGQWTITSGLIQRAKRFGFSIALMTHSMKPYQILSNGAKGNTLLRKRQYAYQGEDIARKLIHNKIDNQIIAIRKTRQPNLLMTESIQQLIDIQNRLSNYKNNQSILGSEGAASRCYFQQLFCDCNWKGRRPRAKHDISNCLLDIGYTILFSLLEAMLECFGFDTYCGFYHRLFYQRKSLVCDIIEPFRCIVDYEIRKMHRLKQIKETDFSIFNHQYQLTYQKAKPYVQTITKAILAFKDEMFLYVQHFYRAFMQEKELSEYPVFIYK